MSNSAPNAQHAPQNHLTTSTDVPVVKRLRRLIAEDDIDLAFVEAVSRAALENQPLPEDAAAVREQRGDRYHADLLFALTHRFYPYDEARSHWARLLDHRRELHERLGRDPGMAVAALDYLTNEVDELRQPRIIDARHLERIADRAIHDPLTALSDRGTFEVLLRSELQRCRRYGTPLGLVLLDLDDFKTLNDTRGHAAGDGVLRRVASLLETELRDIDIPCRYGGEELAALLPNTWPAEARAAAERLRQRVEADAECLGVTASFGVASAPGSGVERGALIEAADAALYRAKARGKNRVCASHGSSRP